MSFAIRKDGKGWRAVEGPDDVGVDETYSATQPEPVEPGIPTAIDALDGLIALHAAGLDAAYTAWANSPDRTFLERAFIDKAKTWRRDDPVLIAGAAALGLTEAQLDALFLSAGGA